MLEIKLAVRNLLGAGLRTALNVFVLSLSYVIIIWHQGMYYGMQRTGERETVKDEIAGGQYWHKDYDPFDLIGLDSSRDKIPAELKKMIENNEAAAILIRQGTVYNKGRAQSILIKGIDPEQKIVSIPYSDMKQVSGELPVMLGKRMAKSLSVQKGDLLTLRWRDSRGTFDAREAAVAGIFDSIVPNIDLGQVWVPLDKLQKMTLLADEATVIIVSPSAIRPENSPGWVFRSREYLLKDLSDMVKSKRAGSAIMNIILLFLAMVAIFDTQVFSIFRRRKEIGTMIALGMTRLRVIRLFTIEGMMNGILALFMGAIYGVPVIILTAQKGIPIPQTKDSWGYAMTERLFPVYPLQLVLGTVIIVMLTVTVVSFLPAKKISGLIPTDALKGKIS